MEISTSSSMPIDEVPGEWVASDQPEYDKERLINPEIRKAQLHETRQIKAAFIDGYLSAKGSDSHQAEAEEAWKRENVTEYLT